MKISMPTKIDGHKTFPFEMKSFEEDGDFFSFEGYLSTFGNEDRGGDVVNKGAFVDSLKEHMPSLLWMHKTDEPVGVFDSMVEDDIGLYVKGRMPKDDDFVLKRVMPQMKIGSIKSMSIGYSAYGKDGISYDKGVRQLNKLFLWEGSLVTIPMNEMATIKSKAAASFSEELPIAPRPTLWDELPALGRIRDWAGTDSEGLQDPDVQDKYKEAFLWYDQEDPDMFGSYKLLVADIIEGELTIVPRAVFQAAARMNGARGGIWFWFEEDRPKVMNTIEKYYNKMGLANPFGKTFRIDDFKAHDERTLEELFHNGVKVSSKSAVKLVSFIKQGADRDDQTSVSVDTDLELIDMLESLKSFKK